MSARTLYSVCCPLRTLDDSPADGRVRLAVCDEWDHMWAVDLPFHLGDTVPLVIDNLRTWADILEASEALFQAEYAEEGEE